MRISFTSATLIISPRLGRPASKRVSSNCLTVRRRVGARVFWIEEATDAVESRTEETSGFITTTAWSAKYIASRRRVRCRPGVAEHVVKPAAQFNQDPLDALRR